MLTGNEVATGFSDGTFTVDNSTPTPCGANNIRQQVPPNVDVGSESANGVASFREELFVYGAPADAQKVLDIIKNESQCPNPTQGGGEPVVFSSPKDVSSDVTTPVEAAIEIDVQTTEGTGQVFVIKDGGAVVMFTFAAQNGTDFNQLPQAIDVVNKGLKKIVG
jgi:hypothetical protein